MDTVEIVEDLWQKAEEFMLQAGTRMVVRHVGTADNLHLFKTILESKVLLTYISLHDLLCKGVCGAGIRVTKTKCKMILEFKGTHDKNSHCL
jgi:hypothetical protein